jgi:hypothetical protein
MSEEKETDKFTSNFDVTGTDLKAARKKFSDKEIDKKMKSIIKKVDELKQGNIRSEVYHHIAIEMKKNPKPKFEIKWLENAVNIVSRRIRDQFKNVELPVLGFILGGNSRRWDDGNHSGNIITVAKLYNENKGKFDDEFKLFNISVWNEMSDPDSEKYIFEDIMMCDPVLYSFKVTKGKGSSGDRYYWAEGTEIVDYYASLQGEKAKQEALKENHNIETLKDLFMWNEEKKKCDFIITLDQIEKLGYLGFGYFYLSKVWVRRAATRTGLYSNILTVSDDDLTDAYDEKLVKYDFCWGQTSDIVHDFDVRDKIGVDSTVYIVYYVNKSPYTNKNKTFECPKLVIFKVVSDEEANEDIEPTVLSDYPGQDLFNADEGTTRDVDFNAMNTPKGELDGMLDATPTTDDELFGDDDDDDEDGETFSEKDLLR